jgi:hypothetical protein
MNAKTALKTIPAMLALPFRVRRNPPEPPTGAEHYDSTPTASSPDTASVKATDIPVAHTPPGGYEKWPPPVLSGCDEPLAEGAPDLRGIWRAYRGPLKGHIERVEQGGDRVVITAGGLIHDMYANGTLAGGVNDIGEGTGDDISVAARFEDGRLNLYPGDRGVAVVTRYRDGDDMVWRYGPFKNRLRRLPAPS